jgi:hypothetical protein
VAERWGRVCVAQFNRDMAKSEKVIETKGKDAWENGRYIDKQSWSIMPGDEKPDSGIADACAKQLAQKT